MKKFKYLLIMFVAVMVTVSCSNDDDDKDSGNNDLVGTWGVSESIDGFEISIKVTFNADATGIINSAYTVNGETETEIDDFTWSTSGNQLTMVLYGDPEISTYSISGNKLTITQDGETTVLTKQ